MKHTQKFLEFGKQIDIFDDLFPMDFRVHAYSMFLNSLYKIGWSDSDEPEKRKHDHFLHSLYDQKDLNYLGIMNHLENVPEVVNLLDGLTFQKGVVNLSNPSDVNYIHRHQEKKIALYYGNTTWNEGAHGETHFYSENLKEIQFSMPYTCGRLVVFDGNIPHCIRPQSIDAPKFRFSFAMVWN